MTDLPRIPLAGVIGHPIAHSRLPALYGYWLRRYGLAGHYVPLDVSQNDLAEALGLLPRLGFVGLNVADPHREAILGIADIVTDRAALIGAANTLIFRRDGKLHADNTEGAGFIANLKQCAPDWDPSSGPAALFGAGGAARAVVAALLEVGVPELRIANRTRLKAETLRADFGARLIVHDWNQAGQMLEDAALVVNTTPIGMSGKPDFQFGFDALTRDSVVTDLVSTPVITQFLAEAEARGCKIVDGLGTVLHQAAPAFERWFDRRPDIDEATRRAVVAS